MAYDPLNSPVCDSPSTSTVIRTTTTSTANLWYYNDADSLATVQGAGYFTNGYELGMRVGDKVEVAVSGVLKTPAQYVSVATVNGAVTIADATA